jgi:hypothetical protein
MIGDGDFLAFPVVLTRVTFTEERAFARSLALLVGVVQRAGGPITATEVRPLDSDGGVEGHFHAAAFPYRAFKKGRIDLGEAVHALFDTGGLQGILHLLHDDRAIAGVGQSELTRGVCWIGRIGGQR